MDLRGTCRLVLGLLLIGFPGSGAVLGQELAYRLAPGEKVNYRVTSDTSVEMTSMSITTTNRQILDILVEAPKGLGADPEPVPIRLTLRRVRVTGAMADYDSDREDNHSFEPLPSVLGLLVGKPFELQVTRTGKFSGHETLDALIGEAVDAIAREQPHMNVALAQLRPGLTGETLLADLTKSWIELPADLSPETSVWEGKLSHVLPNFGTLNETVKYEIENLSGADGRSVATLRGKSELTLTPGNPFVRLIGGKASHLIRFSLGEGRVESSTHETDVETALKFPGTEESRGKMAMKTVVERVR